MENINVVFRLDKEDKEPVAFFLDFPARHGNIAYYSMIDGHGEADLLYYVFRTEMARQEDYRDILETIKTIYQGYNIVVKSRIAPNKLEKNWIS